MNIEQPKTATAPELFDEAIACQKKIDNHYYHELEHAKLKRKWENAKFMAEYRYALLVEDKKSAELFREFYIRNEGISDVSNIGWVQDQVPHDRACCDICDETINSMSYQYVARQLIESQDENEELKKQISNCGECEYGKTRC